MKLSFLFGALLAGTLFTSQAQAQTGPHIGIVTGYNSTWVLDQKLFDDPNYEYRKTWNAAPIGFALGYKFNPNTDLQIEINKTNMGAEYDIKDSGLLSNGKTVGEKEIKLSYWSVPLLYKFTSDGENVRFSFQFGPQFSFLSDGSEVNKLNEDATLKVNLQSTDQSDPSISTDTKFYKANTYTIAQKSDFNKTDIGAVLGLGLEADITTNLYLSGNLRFYYGFKDIRSDASVDEAEARGYYDSRNNVSGGVQLGLHYRFDLK
jgi:opacity protein-like surface antigen